MSGKHFELAVYGKGGIGKSTMSANLSAALASTNRRVLQIGCDPKHDSVRLLMHGEIIRTVLDYLKDTPMEMAKPEDILHTGIKGIGCIEAGGPRPGVGCAGRGIISAFTFLENHKLKEQYDLIVYDVLGDVVCGGFAVPVRREYADAVFLVTSGEYMALYAANNILRGIRNFDGDLYSRVAGIIYNERKITDEDGRVARFAKAVGLPICVKVPRSDAFAKAEEANRTVMEIPEFEYERGIFMDLAGKIHPDMPLYKACPLSDEELEQVVLGIDHGIDVKELERAAAKANGVGLESISAKANDISAIPSAPPAKRLPLYGCAFNGAATQAVNLTDAIVICHSPKACAFYTLQNISSPGRKNLFSRGILMPSAVAPNLECTNMGHTEAVFGGNQLLKESVARAMEKKPGAIIVVSSCVSGIIGDDMLAVEEMGTPECPVIVIPADGDINGDYMEGIRMCMHIVAERLIDPTLVPEARFINLIGEPGVGNNTQVNYENMVDMLSQMDISVNCRFLGNCTVDELRNFLRAPLNVLATEGPDGEELKQWLQTKYGCQFMEDPMPVGVHATSRWLRKLGVYFGREEKAERIIAQYVDKYREASEALKPALAGKKLFVTTINVNIDWLLEAARDTGMEIVYIGVMNYLRQEIKVTEHPEDYPALDPDFEWTQMMVKIQELKPDLVLANYVVQNDGDTFIADAIPMLPVTGFMSGLAVTKRWAELFETKREGAWKDDRALFDKYFS